MGYGTYGGDDTCPCGKYWRSCSLHSLTGPNPGPGEVQAVIARQQEQRDQVQRSEQEARGAYNRLDSLEQAIADALWADFRLNYPGVTGPISEAVQHHEDSWVISQARTTCRTARLVVKVMRSHEAVTR